MLEKLHVVTPEFTREIFSCLNSPHADASGWRYHLSSGIFAEFIPVHLSLPADGWKLRINVHLEDAIRLLRVVVPVLAREKLAFKVLADSTVYRVTFSKQIPAAEAGKFLTIYVPTAEVLTRLANELDVGIAHLAVLPCAHPVSDTPFSNSNNISYRYGSYTDSAFVRGRDGHLVEDCRDFFQLPPGVEDPFTGEVGGEDDDDGTDAPVRIGNYEIASVLHRTYPSAVYLGTQKSDGLEIVLKEARPHAYVQDVPAKERLENEYRILTEIAAFDCSGICPVALEKFEVEAHLFLAMTKIRDTVSLYQWRQHHRNPADHFRIGQKIAEVLARLHSELSIAWGDIHASNVLVDAIRKTKSI